MSLLHRKPDPKLGELMIELRDTYAKLASREAQVQNLLRENERLSEAIDHRGCLARIEELELEVADYQRVHSVRNDRERNAIERAQLAEQKMAAMKERLEAIIEDSLEQLGRTADPPHWAGYVVSRDEEKRPSRSRDARDLGNLGR